MRPKEIQSELARRNISQRKIAIEAGRSAFHVSTIINKKRRGSRELMALIAAKIDRDPVEVFPKEMAHRLRKSPWDKARKIPAQTVAEKA